MPVSLPLSTEEADVVRSAAKLHKIDIAINGRNAQLTGDNFVAIRDALKALHEKKRKIKTRTVQHLEICWNVQRILDKMQGVAGSFGVPTDTFDATNDNTSGPVEVTEVTITAEEASGETDTGSDTSFDGGGGDFGGGGAGGDY